MAVTLSCFLTSPILRSKTQEIAHNVQEAAKGTSEVSANINGVSQAAGETGAAAGQVQVATAEMAKQGERLKAAVDGFLADVRAA